MTKTEDLSLQALALAIREQSCELKKMQETLTTIQCSTLPQWIDLNLASKLKGVSSYRSLQKKPWQQPCCGTNFKKSNGHRVWTKDIILEWIDITDDTLEVYAEKYGVDISNVFKDGRTIQKKGE